MGYLRRTGGRLPTDTLEFLEPLDEEQTDGHYTVEFPVAGWRYYDGEKAIHEIAPGTGLDLKLDTENAYDPCAIRIYSRSGLLLGYVPRIYAHYIDEAVDHGDYTATVKEVGPKDDPQVRVVVNLRCGVGKHAFRAVPDGLAALCG